MPVIYDDEFGKITIRRSARSSQIRVRVAPDGSLRASMPLYAPIFLVKRLVKNSRPELREIIQRSYKPGNYSNGTSIGKSHRLVVRHADDGKLAVRRYNQEIILHLPLGVNVDDPDVTKQLTSAVISALRVEAKSYLPKRLMFLANKHGLKYRRVRFSHASGRWGSCSSNGTVSLNIALMKLPFELIDYVIIHELVHTIHMNHSRDFWALVAKADPDFKAHRKLLKQESPSI
jgi:hypothetical protein